MVRGVALDVVMSGRRWLDWRGRSRGSLSFDNLVVVLVIVFGRQRQKGGLVGINGLTPEFQMPVDKLSLVLVLVVIANNQRPGTNAILAPVTELLADVVNVPIRRTYQ